MGDLKVALVHDWLIGMRGGEKVLEALCELYPAADIYTLLYEPAKVSAALKRMTIKASWLQRLPFVRFYYRFLLPLMPRAIQSFDLSGYDLVISSSHCVAKGARIAPTNGGRRPLHICYCHTPMRYLYYQFDNYFRRGSLAWARPGAALFRPWLARWDRASARSVDHFLANSTTVRARIAETYARDSTVIHPPVDTEFFDVAPQTTRASYFLVVGALVPYKRVDLAIEACRRLGVPLKIVGVGSDAVRLRRLAAGADVEFLGWQSDEALRARYQACAALLYPQEEDFGISAIEAMACGCPVAAYGKGGVLDSVVDGTNGVLFSDQSPEALAAAIERLRSLSFDAHIIRSHALRFARPRFLEQIRTFIDGALRTHSGGPAAAQVRRPPSPTWPASVRIDGRARL